MTLRSILRKVLRRRADQSIPHRRENKSRYENIFMIILKRDSFGPLVHPPEHQSYSSKKQMVHYAFAWIIVVLIESRSATNIHFHAFQTILIVSAPRKYSQS